MKEEVRCLVRERRREGSTRRGGGECGQVQSRKFRTETFRLPKEGMGEPS